MKPGRGMRGPLPVVPEAPAPVAEAIDWVPGSAMTAPLPQTHHAPPARAWNATAEAERPQAPEPDAASPDPPSASLEEAGTPGPESVEIFTVPEAHVATTPMTGGNDRATDAVESDGGEVRGGPEADDTEGSGAGHADGADRAGAHPTPRDLPDALVAQAVGIGQTVGLALWVGRGSTDIAIVQDAAVDQDADIDIDADGQAVPGSAHLAVDGDMDFSIRQVARVDVVGWDGAIVTRIVLDQEVVLDQDFAVTVFVGADGACDVKVDQGLLIDQAISVSIALAEQDGALHVDMTIIDRARIDQDTSVLVDDDGDGESEAAIVQDVEVAQDVFLRLDVEDGLDDLYDVSLSLVVRQAVDVDQDAEIRSTAGEDGVEIEVEADQAAGLDQEITVHLDFDVA